MKILIVSDTHGSFFELKKVIAQEKPFDVMIHCGDVCGSLSSALGKTDYQIHAVCGNCDAPSDALPPTCTFALGSHRVFLAHGHRHAVDSNDDMLVRTAKAEDCDIAMYGHTHVPECILQDGVRVINPGSLTRPRTQDRRGSYMIMEIDDATGKTVFDLRYPDIAASSLF